MQVMSRAEALVAAHQLKETGDQISVLMMCGVAGSGKSTFAKALAEQGWVRLSIDEEVWERHGRFGVDYRAEEYAALSAEAERTLRQRLETLLAQGEWVVIDFSFWRASTRSVYRDLIARYGRKSQLVYFRVDEDELRRRLRNRREIIDANGAFPITDELFQEYILGFEAPEGPDIWLVDETMVASGTT